MPLIFITGISGAGKSTVREELARRGFPAYDTDEDAIAQWRNRVSGKVTPLVDSTVRTPEFIAQNEWKADPERVRQLAEEGQEGVVFLCGSIANDDEVGPFFDTVFLLSIDETAMRSRLAARTAHDFGTRPHELELILAYHALMDDYYVSCGAIVVDASRPPPLVVDEILQFCAI